MRRYYTCTIEHGGGFGGGYGGTYAEQFVYESSHRADSRANEEEALAAWRRSHGRAGWAEVVPGSIRLGSFDD